VLCLVTTSHAKSAAFLATRIPEDAAASSSTAVKIDRIEWQTLRCGSCSIHQNLLSNISETAVRSPLLRNSFWQLSSPDLLHYFSWKERFLSLESLVVEVPFSGEGIDQSEVSE
jgi:hypothetical protein